MAKRSLIFYLTCAFVIFICHAQRTDFGHHNKDVEILFNKMEIYTNETFDIRKELEAQSAINEDASQNLKKLSSRQIKFEIENQALNQTLLEIQNDIENIKTQLTKLQVKSLANTTRTTTTTSTPMPQPTTVAGPTTTAPFLHSCDEG